MFAVSEVYASKNNCDQSLPVNHEKISQSMESELTRREERSVDPGDHRYRSRVAGVVEIRRISEPAMGSYLPVCDVTAPHRLVSLYHPPTKVGGRCGARTNQRF